MENQKLSVVEKVGFGAGDMAVNVMVAALFYFMSFFYTDIYGLDPVDMGILFLVARFVPNGSFDADQPNSLSLQLKGGAFHNTTGIIK